MLPPVKTNGPGLGNRDRPRACLDASRPPPNVTTQVPGAIDTPYRWRSPRHARAVYLSYEYFPVCAIRVCILRRVSFLNPCIAHAAAHFHQQSKFFRAGGTGGASSTVRASALRWRTAAARRCNARERAADPINRRPHTRHASTDGSLRRPTLRCSALPQRIWSARNPDRPTGLSVVVRPFCVCSRKRTCKISSRPSRPRAAHQSARLK